MKNREILLEAIGETDEKLIPELTPKRKPNRFLKWAAVGSVCAAAVIACVIVFPKAGKNKPLYAVSDKAAVLAAAEYPEMPVYPDAGTDPDGNSYDAWDKARTALRNQPEGYQDGFNDFFLSSADVFLNKSSTDNQAYSPLSLFMALGMSAESSCAVIVQPFARRPEGRFQVTVCVPSEASAPTSCTPSTMMLVVPMFAVKTMCAYTPAATFCPPLTV